MVLAQLVILLYIFVLVFSSGNSHWQLERKSSLEYVHSIAISIPVLFLYIKTETRSGNVCDISPSTVGFVVRLIAHEVGV